MAGHMEDGVKRLVRMVSDDFDEIKDALTNVAFENNVTISYDAQREFLVLQGDRIIIDAFAKSAKNMVNKITIKTEDDLLQERKVPHLIDEALKFTYTNKEHLVRQKLPQEQCVPIKAKDITWAFEEVEKRKSYYHRVRCYLYMNKYTGIKYLWFRGHYPYVENFARDMTDLLQERQQQPITASRKRKMPRRKEMGPAAKRRRLDTV